MMNCDCHGEEMRFIKDSRYRAGGFWRCKVKHRESVRRWQNNLSGSRLWRRQLQSRRSSWLHNRRRRLRGEGGTLPSEGRG